MNRMKWIRQQRVQIISTQYVCLESIIMTLLVYTSNIIMVEGVYQVLI